MIQYKLLKMLYSFYQDFNEFFNENTTNVPSFIRKLKEIDFESPYTDPRVVNRGFHPIVFILIGRHAYQRTEWQAKEENRGYFPPVSIHS